MGRMTAEQIFRGMFRGPLTTKIGNTNPWAGRLSVTTASAVSSVATALVNSDSIILLGQEAVTAQSTGTSAVLEVSSINPGVGFTVRTADGQAPLRNLTAHWVIFKTQ